MGNVLPAIPHVLTDEPTKQKTRISSLRSIDPNGLIRVFYYSPPPTDLNSRLLSSFFHWFLTLYPKLASGIPRIG